MYNTLIEASFDFFDLFQIIGFVLFIVSAVAFVWLLVQIGKWIKRH